MGDFSSIQWNRTRHVLVLARLCLFSGEMTLCTKSITKSFKRSMHFHQHRFYRASLAIANHAWRRCPCLSNVECKSGRETACTVDPLMAAMVAATPALCPSTIHVSSRRMVEKATWLADSATGTRRFVAWSTRGVMAAYGISQGPLFQAVLISMHPSTAARGVLPLFVSTAILKGDACK